MDRAADPLCGVVERLAEQLSLQPIEGVDPHDYLRGEYMNVGGPPVERWSM